MPVAAAKGSELIKDINNVLINASHHVPQEDFWFRRKLIEAEKLKAVNKVEAFNIQAQLYGLAGDKDTAEKHIDTAIWLGNSALLRINKAVILSNLGYFSSAVAPFIEGVEPTYGLFTSRWKLALCLGCFHTIAEIAEKAKLMNLEHFEFVDAALISKVVRVMDEVELTDQQLAAALDCAGELLRENRLFFAGDGPEVSVWDEDSLEKHVSFAFKLAIPIPDAVALDEELGHRLFEKHGELPPEVTIHFESSLSANERIAERPSVAG